MTEWLAMGGYGFYIWMSYGLLALAIGVELRMLRSRRRAAHQNVAQMMEDDA